MFQSGLLVCHLLILATALLYVLSRFPLPPILRPIVRFHYGMIAPYQGDTDWNAALSAVATLPGGATERVDLSPYFPHFFGEANARQFLLGFQARGDLVRREKYAELAQQLLERERVRGKRYASLALSFDQWPRSPEGFFALHDPEHLVSFFLARAK